MYGSWEIHFQTMVYILVGLAGKSSIHIYTILILVKQYVGIFWPSVIIARGRPKVEIPLSAETESRPKVT